MEAGDHYFVSRLLAHGVDPSPSDGHGRKPLHYAVLSGNKELVLNLLIAGADVNALTDTWAIKESPRPSGLSTGSQWTGHVLHLAAMMGNKEITALLLTASTTKGSKVMTNGYHYHRPLHGPTALHIALGTGSSY